MIANYLKDLTEISGVEAVIVFDNQGNIFDIWHHPEFNVKVLSELSISLLHVLGLAEELQYPVEEIVVPFDKGLIFVKNHAQFFLTVISKISVEISLIRLLLNVKFYELKNDKKARKMIKKLAGAKFSSVKFEQLDDLEKSIFKKLTGSNND